MVAVVIALVFLYFYKPFEIYLLERIPGIHFSNVLFWFASLVAVVAYVIAHWQSFRRQVFRDGGELDATALVYDTLQIAIPSSPSSSFAGAIIQAIEMLSELLMAPAGAGAGAGVRGRVRDPDRQHRGDGHPRHRVLPAAPPGACAPHRLAAAPGAAPGRVGARAARPRVRTPAAA